jgi:hypothetical protein
VAVNACIVPAGADGLAGETVIEVNWVAAPVPCSVAVCGLLGALSTTVRVPETWPMADGINVTLITQLPEAGTVGHVVAAKGPVVVTLVTVNDVD